ncbi:23S rRNA (guanosine(2251)-2'-O)-methyltransferase RlmB [Actinomycetospora termitidis]|uniref:23S rRNA (Guanosine(2251)-2'-O)-methyltransferase RlmB n=1 Tax=Actinomycetospora termitidis TaxID=3053470 RepID=A0ABT7ME29_9PSEU|nr:23S rRNA (guanosine(2251)-2'-O)-methyltransferase RlmB [Actinomycetospora sp. Odt1-22]MDL5157618.1 23S rRNA (guanosine(2251)-2'-O)-methyltransferase RlmB [Actinomycetospora sp. Odt1-22]
MAGNSRRPGARRNPGTKKGPTKGSGGNRAKGLEGKGPTPKAENRPNHKAYEGGGKTGKSGHGAAAARRPSGPTSRGGPSSQAGPTRRRERDAPDGPQVVVGRNPVIESLRANIPATALHVAQGIDIDDRVREALRTAGDRGISVLEVPRADVERLADGSVHQGLALSVPAFEYLHPDDLLEEARQAAHLARTEPLLVALDGVTDPRNLGAVVRSAAAFGAHGVLLPLRRSVGVTPVAWRTSAGAAARLPIGRATNLSRTLGAWNDDGFVTVGLDGEVSTTIDDLDAVAGPDAARGPLVLVVGSEGKGLSRLVRETCTGTVAIPMAGDVESLNASVAAGVALAEVARRRRSA